MFKYYLSIFIWSICCFPFLLCSAQTKPSINFKNLNTEDGLSSNTIESVIQDKNGFIWLGTENGLNRYDAYQFRTYKNLSQEPHSLSNNYINSLFVDSQKQLWILTANGLNLYKEETDSFEQHFIKNTIGDNNFLCMTEDSKGQLWLSCNKGIYSFNKQTKLFQRFTPTDELSKNWNLITFTKLLVDKKGNLWIGSRQSGLFIKNPDGHVKSAEKLFPELRAIKSINDIKEDQDGSIWVGTNGQGLVRINPTSKQFNHYEYRKNEQSSLSSGVVKSILIDQINRVWVGMENSGLSLFNQKFNSFHHYQNNPSNPQSLSQKTISALFEDQQGNIWLGTHRGGVNFFNPKLDKFEFYTSGSGNTGLSYKDVKSFFEDQDGTIYIGTDGGGLNTWDRKNNIFQHYKHDPLNPHSISSDAVLHIVKDGKGNIWVSTWGAGLNLFDNKSGTFKRFTHDPDNPLSISSNYIWRTFEDSKGNLWIATSSGGINKFNSQNQTFEQLKWKNKSYQNSTNYYCIAEDEDGDIWFGSDNGILLRYNIVKEQLSSYKIPNFDNKNPPNIAVWVIFKDSNNKLWFGQKGLFYFDNLQNKILPAKSNLYLHEESIQGILEDNYGNLWLSTKNGLFQYHIKTQQITHFTMPDGLQGLEFGPNACLKTKKAELLFGGSNGFNLFKPEKLQYNRIAPEIFWTDFQLFPKSQAEKPNHYSLKEDISVNKEIVLKHNQSTFSIQFTALNFVSSKKNQFAYKLGGLDKNWNYVNESRTATYANLKPGTYLFSAKAANNDGVWNVKTKSIKIIVIPPFWKLWWFKSLVSIFIVCLITSFVQLYRDLELRKTNENKQKEIPMLALQRSNLSKLLQKRDEEFLHNLQIILNKHLDDPNLKVGFLSQEMGMSQSKFFKKIKEITGLSISEYVRKIRLERARQILLTEDIAITQVMHQVGISSSSYFTNAFKKEFGKTPTEYLKQVRKKN